MSLWFTLFLSLFVVFASAVLVWHRAAEAKRSQRFAKSLASGMDADTPKVITTVLVPQAPSTPNGLSRWLNTGWFSKGVAANSEPNSRKASIVAVGAGVAGLLLGLQFTHVLGVAAPVLGAMVGFLVPPTVAVRKRNKRLRTLEEQFPEALDFLGRSIRAGNAFSIGLELLGAETAEPLKSEILKMTREIALGSRLEDALQGLITRVPLVEVRFFASAVLLQRETGGNLGEVLSKLSFSLRERMRLRGQVKAASGQGRMTAGVLTVLPVATLCLLKLSSPDYLNSLTNDPLGRNLLGAAVVSQVLGYLCMKNIINIEV